MSHKVAMKGNVNIEALPKHSWSGPYASSSLGVTILNFQPFVLVSTFFLPPSKKPRGGTSFINSSAEPHSMLGTTTSSPQESKPDPQFLFVILNPQASYFVPSFQLLQIEILPPHNSSTNEEHTNIVVTLTIYFGWFGSHPRHTHFCLS